MKLVVQIPAFNEEETIGRALAALPRSVAGFDAVETLVVDDGSTDATSQRAREAGATRVVRLTTNRGLAEGFLRGLAAALGMGADVIVNFDADLQYDAADIPALVAPDPGGPRRLHHRRPRSVGARPLLAREAAAAERRLVGRAAGLRDPGPRRGLRLSARCRARPRARINVFLEADLHRSRL
jgi:glycosyltransferase involved in cell wall biosynthesis